MTATETIWFAFIHRASRFFSENKTEAKSECLTRSGQIRQTQFSLSNHSILPSFLEWTKWLQGHRTSDSYPRKQDASQSTLGKIGAKYAFLKSYFRQEAAAVLIAPGFSLRVNNSGTSSDFTFSTPSPNKAMKRKMLWTRLWNLRRQDNGLQVWTLFIF